MINKLKDEIIKLSKSNNWDSAVLEWELSQIWFNNSTCLCGHNIIENCQIINIFNKKTAIVGNCCVKKFMKNIESDKYFRSLKKIKLDDTKSLIPELIQYSFEEDIINQWEYEFYFNTLKLKPRKMTPKQRVIRVKINNKILSKLGIKI